MTRKDYIALAAALNRVRRSYAPHWDPNLFRACTDHANALADVLSAGNPRFDRVRFMDESGVPADPQSRRELLPPRKFKCPRCGQIGIGPCGCGFQMEGRARELTPERIGRALDAAHAQRVADDKAADVDCCRSFCDGAPCLRPDNCGRFA